MKGVLLGLSFAVLLSSNITKWFLDVGFRIGYHVPFLILWLFALVIAFGGQRVALAPPLRALVALKVAFVCAIALAAPAVILNQNPDALTQYLKGFTTEAVNCIAVAAMLFYASQLDARGRRRLLDLYLLAIGLLAAYSLAQAAGAYLLGIDLDKEVTAYLPLWSSLAPSVTEDRIGFFGTAIYKLSGATGDPNLNGLTFAIALPVIFLRSSERSRLILGALAVILLLIIAGTLSATVWLIVLASVPVMMARAITRARQRSLALLVGVSSIAFGVVLWRFAGDIVSRVAVLKFSLTGGGTISTHANIASDAISLWANHPFGIGLNGFPLISKDRFPHNTYLQALVELGPFGLLVILGTALAWIGIGLKSRNETATPALLCAAALALAGFGHDVLNRLELQLVVSMMIAFAATGGLDPRPGNERTSGWTEATSPP